MRKFLPWLLGGLVLAAGGLAAIAPDKLSHNARAPNIQGPVDDWLARQEDIMSIKRGVIEGAEKQISWNNTQVGEKTPWVVVYIHGFSASRQELAPVPALIAERLSANLFETRLSGHGIYDEALEYVVAEQWLDDTAEALSVGAALGDKLLVMGTSTGATLLVAMAGHPLFEPVEAVVLLSPNFGPSDSKGELLTFPGGLQLAHLLVGERRTWTPANELQAAFWVHDYPMRAAQEVMRLVDYSRDQLPMELNAGLLVLFSPEDRVVSVDRLLDGVEQISSSHKQLLELPTSGKGGNHVLAGDILMPQNNELMADAVVDFVAARLRD